jgi:transporter family protein
VGLLTDKCITLETILMVDIAVSTEEKGKATSPSEDGSALALQKSEVRSSAIHDQHNCNAQELHFCKNATGESQNELSLDSTGPPQGLVVAFGAASKTLQESWFWYSIAASLCWTAWAFTARLGSEEIPPTTMQFVSAFGFLLVGLVVVAVQRPQLMASLRGNCYALLSGILLGLGGIALYGAYRTGENASIVTATTSLYPVGTILLAVTFLREKLNKFQFLGLCLVMVSILVLSLQGIS